METANWDFKHFATWLRSKKINTHAPVDHQHLSQQLLSLPSPLPERIPSLVVSVRIWRKERPALTQALVEYSQYSLSAGADPANLLQDFSEPTQQKNLARAFTKKRPIELRFLLALPKLILMLIVVLGIPYSFLAYRYYAHSVVIDHDYAAPLIASIEAIPESERAWPRYNELVKTLNKLEGYYLPEFNPDKEGWSEYVIFLEGQQESLSLMREIGQMQHLGFIPRVYVPGIDRVENQLEYEEIQEYAEFSAENEFPAVMMNMNLSPVPRLRYFMQYYLLPDAKLAMIKNEPEIFTQDILALIGMSNQLRELEFLDCDLAAISMFEKANTLLTKAITHNPYFLQDDQLQRLSNRIAEYGMGRSLLLQIEVERAKFYDVIQRIYTNDQCGSGSFSLSGFSQVFRGATGDYKELIAAPIQCCFFASRRDIVAKYDQIMDRMEAQSSIPFWKCNPRSLDDIFDEIDQSKRYSTVIRLGIFDPECCLLYEYCTQRIDATLVMIGLIRHYQKQGEWPNQLAELVPEFLDEIPLDRVDGKPLRYCLKEGKPLLYSIGLDRVDDGGVPAMEDGVLGPTIMHAAKNRQVSRGDWILWDGNVQKINLQNEN